MCWRAAGWVCAFKRRWTMRSIWRSTERSTETATSASTSASARPSDQREADVRPAARSADLPGPLCRLAAVNGETVGIGDVLYPDVVLEPAARHALILAGPDQFDAAPIATLVVGPRLDGADRCLLGQVERSEEHTSELQSLMRISYAVFCLKK